MLRPRTSTLRVLGLVAVWACDGHIDRASSTSDTDAGLTPDPDSGTPDLDQEQTHPSLGPVQPCSTPMPEPRWRERGEELGLPSRPDDGRIAAETYIAVDDFDGNGRLDVISSLFGHRGPSAPPEPLVVSWWEADGFHTDNIDGIELAWAPTLADLDDDGDLDVITAGSQEWLRNDDSLFTPVYWEGITEARILYVREFEPYDLNQDGHLDLFGLSTNQDADPELGNEVFFWGLGSGEYVEVNDVIPALDIPGSGFDSFWIDWFGDGQAEVFVANDRGALHAPNSLLQWTGDRFEDIAPELGLDLAHDAMGADAADFNKDGVPDLYITATHSNVLLLSQPDGVHVDVATALNADPVSGTHADLAMGWAGLFVDHDNDGQLDLFTTQGDWWHEPEDRLPFLVQILAFDGDTFVDVSMETGLTAEGSFRGAVARDFNNDGVLDFLVSSVFDHLKLFLSEGCTQNAWMSITAPQAARIQVHADDQVWTDWSKGSSGFGAHARPMAHFGLGSLQTVDRIEVILPGGEPFVIDGPIATRRHVQIPPPAQ